ncbi:MAG: J domain-containing protein [Pelagibacteraceae bacterium TMED124]|nr:MAG: J domain-containing protein [Pelagibacteraceae bacterium TMED124]|tara:strand:- start:537 stop:1517 length:981 start_codon:yes stop_codon:yes gene_type:complete
MDYYKVLGVDSNASESEIKKAYRRLSLQYHPDKQTGSAEKFKQINEAYQTLGTSEKRQMYDLQQKMGGGEGRMPFPGGFPMPFPFGEMRSGGMPFPGGRVHIGVMPMNKGNQMPQNGGMDDIFKMFFGMGEAMDESLNGMPINRKKIFKRKPSPIIKEITININEAYMGMNYPLEIERWICSDGVKRMEHEMIYVPIPKGIDNNELIILENKGNCSEEGEKGDIKLFIKIENTSKFIRNGLNLHYKYTITLKEALMGFSFQLEHLNGKTYTINSSNESIVRPGTETTIRDMGFERNNNKGDIIIKFEIIFPKSLSEEQKKKLNEIL